MKPNRIMGPSRLVLFDCDGTLVDSQHMIMAAMAEAFTRHGLLPPPLTSVRGVVGLSLPAAVAVLMPREADTNLIAPVVESYKRAFQHMRADGGEEPLYPGVADMLGALQGAGYILGVATGKSTRGLRSVLKLHGLEDMFMTLQTADDHPGKPHPSMVEEAILDVGGHPGSTVVIGDTTFDMEMARAAGARGLGVSWGYHAPEDLRAAGAHSIFDAAPDIAPLINRLLPEAAP